MRIGWSWINECMNIYYIHWSRQTPLPKSHSTCSSQLLKNKDFTILKVIWSIGNAGSSPYSKNKWKVFLKLLTMKCWCLVAWSGIKLTKSWDITMQFAIRPSANILKGIQLTLSRMHFCVSSISAWWFIWRLCYIRNVLLFPTHLMCTRHLISERLSAYSWFQPGFVKFILLCTEMPHFRKFPKSGKLFLFFYYNMTISTQYSIKTQK